MTRDREEILDDLGRAYMRAALNALLAAIEGPDARDPAQAGQPGANERRTGEAQAELASLEQRT